MRKETFIMYSGNGRTNRTSNATVVKFLTDEGASDFIEQCESEGTSYSGISLRAGKTIFFWSSYRYVELYDDVYDSLGYMFKDGTY